MAFSTVRRAATVSAGFGNPLKNDTLFTNSVSLSGTTNATPVPATGSFAPTICRGWIEVRVFGGGGTSPTISIGAITGTDGTSTVTLYAGDSAASSLSATVSGTTRELLVPFKTDLNLTSITVNTTLAGTSPTATMDIDIAATSN